MKSVPAEFDLPTNWQPLNLEVVRCVFALAKESNLTLYIVGGYLRDALLGCEDGIDEQVAKDLDFAVEGGSAFAFASQVASQLSGHFVPLDQSNDTARVVLVGETILDFSGCVGGSIASDVRRRDFTINALVWSEEKPEKILDFHTGVNDLKRRLIRAPDEVVIADDPLRILRAFRFAAYINGDIEEKTKAWILRHTHALSSVACERINFELFTILAGKNARYLLDMTDAGILEIIFPELTETRKVTANAYHHLPLFEHSLRTIPELEEKLPKLPDWVNDSCQQELSFGITRLAATKLACLLHDIGKPATWLITEEGRHSFLGHDRLGAQMCEVIGQRLKWSKPVVKFISKLVLWHLRPGALFHQGTPSLKAVKRFYRSVNEEVPELLLLAFADFGATKGPALSGQLDFNLNCNCLNF